MAGDVLRYDGQWVYRTPTAQWWRVTQLLPGSEISNRDRERVNDTAWIAIWEGLFQAWLTNLPERLKPDLCIPVPSDAARILAAELKRPSRV